MPEKTNNLQDIFLNTLRKNKTPVTMFLVKGVKLQGIITWFDNFSVLLRRDGQSQLIYKHAISTVMPGGTVDVAAIVTAFNDAARKAKSLQDVFLSAVQRTHNPVTMFLVKASCCRVKLRLMTCSACFSSATACHSLFTNMRFRRFSPPIRSTSPKKAKGTITIERF